jgi:hypothetical protein
VPDVGLRQKRQDDGAWEDWHQGVGSQYVGAWFIGEMGHRYGFRMRGVDRAGNVEAYPGSAEAETYINYCSGDAYESDNGPAQARQIAVGQSQAHNFCGVDDQDWVKFWAWAGKRYVVQTGNLGWTGDTVLTLYDADGTTVLAENDDIAYPDNLASRVEWIAGGTAGSTRGCGTTTVGLRATRSPTPCGWRRGTGPTCLWSCGSPDAVGGQGMSDPREPTRSCRTGCPFLLSVLYWIRRRPGNDPPLPLRKPGQPQGNVALPMRMSWGKSRQQEPLRLSPPPGPDRRTEP